MNKRAMDQAIAERRSWQYRALAYCKGNQSNVGAIIVAMLGRSVAGPGYHTGGMKILADGRVVGLGRANRNAPWKPEILYRSVEELNTVFRGLADVLELSDDDRKAMFVELRRFVAKDDRAVSYLPGITNEDGSKA